MSEYLSVKGKFLSLDTETGGLDSDQHSILSVGMVVLDNGKITNREHIFINEDSVTINKEAHNINKIPLDLIFEQGVSIKEAKLKIVKFLKMNFLPFWKRLLPVKLAFKKDKIVLLGKQIDFDVQFLKRIFGNKLEHIFSYRKIDISSIVYFLYSADILSFESRNLYGLASFFEIPVPVAFEHNALWDAEVTAEIYVELVKLISL